MTKNHLCQLPINVLGEDKIVLHAVRFPFTNFNNLILRDTLTNLHCLGRHRKLLLLAIYKIS